MSALIGAGTDAFTKPVIGYWHRLNRTTGNAALPSAASMFADISTRLDSSRRPIGPGGYQEVVIHP